MKNLLEILIQYLIRFEQAILLPFERLKRLKTYIIYGGASILLAALIFSYYQPFPEKDYTKAAASASPYVGLFSSTSDLNMGSTTANVDTPNSRVVLATASDERITTGQQSLNNPEIIWTGSEYAAVWAQVASGNDDVYFQRFDSSGNPKENPKQITVAAGSTQRPAIAYASSVSRYGLVYQDNRDGDNEIFFSLLDANGDRIGSELQLTVNTNPTLAPSIVWNATSSHFGVSWDDGASGNNDIFFVRVDVVTPAVVGSSVQVNTSALTKTRGETAVAWNSLNNQYLVVWHDNRSVAGEMEIYAHLIDSSGAKIGLTDTRISVAVDDSRNPDVVWDGSNYVIVWEDQRDGNKEIYYEIADSNLNFQLFVNAVRLTNDTSVSQNAQIAGNSSNWGITWDDQRDGNPEIYFARLDSSYNKLGSDTRMTNASGNSTTPTIAFDGSSYSMVYTDFRDNVSATNGNIYFSQTAADGIKRTIYSSSGIVVSNEVDTSSTNIYRAKLTATSNLGTNGLISYYLSSDGGTTFEPTENAKWHVFQAAGANLRWRAILYTSNIQATPQLTQVQIDYVTTSSVPAQVTLLSPTNLAIDQSLTTTLQFRSTDADSDSLQYIVEITADSTFASRRITYDQRLSQTAFSGQNANSSTAYASGTTASFTIPSGVLTTAQTFYWRAWAVDSPGTGQLSTDIATGSAFRFTVVDDHINFTEGFLSVSKVPTRTNVSDNDSMVSEMTVAAPGADIISTVSTTSNTDDVLWNGSNFVITWVNASDVFINSVTVDGVAGTSLNVTNNGFSSSDPSLDSNGSSTGIVFVDSPSGDDVYFQLYNSSLASQIASNFRVSSSGAGTVTNPEIAFNGQEWGIVWSDNRTSNNEIFFTRVNSTGTYRVGSEVNISNVVGTSDTLPDIFWNGSEWGIVWQAATEIFYARVDDTGSMVGSTINLTNSGASSEQAPRIVWNGSLYLITWILSGDVYGTRVASNGQIITAPAVLVNVGNSVLSARSFWNSTPQQFVVVSDQDSTSLTETAMMADIFTPEFRALKSVRIVTSGLFATSPVIAANTLSSQRYGALWSRTLPSSSNKNVTFLAFDQNFIPATSISASQGQVVSNSLDTSSENILSATLTATSALPANTSISYELSNNGGTNFFSVSPSASFTFSTTGSDLRWRGTLASLSTIITPQLQAVTISYGGAPYLSNQSPASGATNVARNTNISFQVNDDQSGVDTTSLVLQVNSSTVVPTITAVSAPNSYSVVYDPPTDFSGGQTVTINVTVSDLSSPAKQLSTSYSFTAIDVSGLSVSPASASLSTGSTTNLTAIATLLSGGTSDVTSQATWSSSDSSIATVSSGVVSGGSAGNATITATYLGYTANSNITVTSTGGTGCVGGGCGSPPGSSLTAVEIMADTDADPDDPIFPLKAVARYSNGTLTDVTTQSVWTSSDTSVAQVSLGTVSAVGPGSAIITATYGGMSDTYNVTFQDETTPQEAVLTSVSLIPETVSILKGEQASLTLKAFYDDGTSKDITYDAMWSSSKDAVATVKDGTVTAVSVGTVTITAAYQGAADTSSVTVTSKKEPQSPPSITSVSVQASEDGNLDDETVPLTAVAHYSDGSSKDVTLEASWSSSDETVAVVSSGIVTQGEPGTSTIEATYSGLTGSYGITVSEPSEEEKVVMTAFEVSPSELKLYVGQAASLSAIVRYSDQTFEDVTLQSEWSTSDEEIATVSLGTIRTLSSGKVLITGRFEDFSDSVSLTVDQSSEGSEDGSDGSTVVGGSPTISGDGQKVSRSDSGTIDVKVSSPPQLVTYYFDSIGRIVLVFDQRMEKESVQDITNYTLIDLDAMNVSVHDQPQIRSVYYNQAYSVFLSVSSVTPQPGEQFELTVRNLMNLDGILISPHPTVVTISQPEEKLPEEKKPIAPSSSTQPEQSQITTLQCSNQPQWEEDYHYQLKPGEGQLDHDQDGVSSLIECENGTDPLGADTDQDGLNDGEEINDYDSDPLVAPPFQETVVLKITNWHDGDKSADSSLLVQGVSSEGSRIHTYVQNSLGEVQLLGISEPATLNKWLVASDLELLDGRYTLLAQDRDPQGKILEQHGVRIAIDSDLGMRNPRITRLSNQEVTPETFLKNIRIVIRDKRPYVIGRTEFGNKAFITWKSLLFTSSLIVDSEEGQFTAAAPKILEEGEHSVWVYAVRPNDQARSKDVNLQFGIHEEENSITVRTRSYLIFGIVIIVICLGAWYLKDGIGKKQRKRN